MKEITKLFDVLEYQLNNFPKSDCISAKENGQWKQYSTQDVKKIVDNVSLSLIKLGLKKDDKVALISPNCPEWNFIDLGTIQIGCQLVPLYPTSTASDFQYTINHSESKVIFVYGKEHYDKIQKIRSELPSVQEIYSIQKIEGVKHFSEFLELGKNDNPDIIKPYRDAVQPTDIVTIVYTSGTTGVPKGVMLSHHNVVSNITTVVKLLPVNNSMKALSFLPLNHIFERIVFYVYMYVGVSIYYAESLDTIRDNLQEVKPHFFTTVPRLLEKVYDKIVLTGTGLKGLKKQLFFWALNLGLKYDFEKENDFLYMFQLGIARKLVFSKWRAALGGNIVAIVSGASALQERLARVFWAAGIPVLEGYGQTETSPVVSVNTLEPIKGCRFGTVGKVIPGVEVKILQEPGYREGEGEILVKGPNVMQGYYKNPEATRETIEPDGWLHTGDIGMLVDGFLKITDRKKELFKTSGGKYIAPQKIENLIKASLYIEQVMVVGPERKFPAALIVPTFANLKEWCHLHNINVSSNEEMIKNPKVIQKIQEEVDKANEQLAQYEKIKKFVLLSKEWTIDSGELTPSMKLKRRVITENYKDLIESMYVE